MFVVYQKLTKKQLADSVKETIPQLIKWFKDNPKRDTCQAEMWYGKVLTVRRDHVEEDVKEAAKKVATEEVAKKKSSKKKKK